MPDEITGRPADVDGDPSENEAVSGASEADGEQDVSQDPSVEYGDDDE